MDAPGVMFYHPPLHRFRDSHDISLDESGAGAGGACARGAGSEGAGAGCTGTGGARSWGARARGAGTGGAGSEGAAAGFRGVGAGGTGFAMPAQSAIHYMRGHQLLRELERDEQEHSAQEWLELLQHQSQT
ncbi:unnamed protein product [Closterium sp. NIES-54]